jgi:hypothetical protein
VVQVVAVLEIMLAQEAQLELELQVKDMQVVLVLVVQELTQT